MSEEPFSKLKQRRKDYESIDSKSKPRKRYRREADRLYEYFQQSVKNAGVAKVEHGKFGASMQVELLNNGPVTIMLDTDEIMPKK